MHKLIETTADWVLAGDQYQDHHGGSVWVKDQEGWLCLQLPLGIEWSAQFCADPAKVDRLRQYASRVVAAFPDTLPGYESLGYPDGESLLRTTITDTATVSAWTDSIFNASLPLPADTHTGVLPRAAGYHHYPKPIVDIDHFRLDSFQLFVKDSDGLPAVVVPVGPRGSGDARVRLLAAHPASAYIHHLSGSGAPPAAHAEGRTLTEGISPDLTAAAPHAPSSDTGEQPDILAADDPLAQQAFARQ